MTTPPIEALFTEVLSRRILNKAVFSKPEDKTVRKAVAAPFKKPDGTLAIKIERFTDDNKVRQQLIAPDNAAFLTRMALEDYRQVNLFTTAGNTEIRRSKSGSTHIAGKLAEDAPEAAASEDKKNYILDGARDAGFLFELGIADKNGRIHDKKQPKFRQINRFLEIVRDVEDALPADRPAVIYDLCCGKSYLTFAVYYYFTVLRGREVHMFGVDLKQDVIAYCNDVAARQHFENLHFVSGNINEYEPPEAPDLVISLHACDIATDIVLYNAIRWGARLILSTPCCHHEMSGQLSAPAENAPLRDELAFILQSPMLKQKFCDAATDALRVKRLESMGYQTVTLELIDPDETPKNLMIRAVKRPHPAPEKDAAALAEYNRIRDGLAVNPFLDVLLTNHER